jgi:class 3 adenylate cyclase/tetratricopeptide (TPR) repeat protein
MRCSNCSIENREGRKFCSECGTPLKTQCQSCGAANELGEKFCGECGKPLASLAQADPTESPSAKVSPAEIRVTSLQSDSSTTIDGERKTVTALFADIKGSTELMAELDPEDARAIIDPALKIMIDAVRRYDGYVVQSTGDGIFALFGAPVAHEDHPQRALYAALRLQEELKRYSAKVVAEGSSPIQGRVGINTGEVVVRSIHTGAGQTEYTPIGHTTNLASRMQTAAPVGSIAVSDITQKLCEGYFVLKPLGATKVKGVGEPVSMYEVTGLGPLRTRLQRAAGRGLTKFVGRDREMDVLKHAIDQACDGHGQIVAAMGDPGVGKSRLFFEFKAIVRSTCLVLEAYSVSHGKASAYLPMTELLREYFRILPEDDLRQRRQRVIGRVLELDRSLEETLPYIFALLGIQGADDPLAHMDAQIRRRRTLDALKRILLRESLNQPLILVFEDLHWIDAQTQEFLNLIADAIGNARVLLLVNYRPEYRHDWGHRTFYTQLRLDPLGEYSAESLLSALMGDAADLTPLKRMIIERTQGNPFFIEEIVQTLFDDGVLVRDGGIQLVRSLSQVRVPATVQGVLAARIDRLTLPEKDLLQTLAVLGREFPLPLVRKVRTEPDEKLEPMLVNLQLGEFIYEQPAVGGIEYIFKHALTQEVAYNSLLSEHRKHLHEQAARALEELFAEDIDDHLNDLAHHYRRSDNIDKGVEYLRRAGQRAVGHWAYTEAIDHFTAAIGLLQKLPDSPQRIRRELDLQLAVGPAFVHIRGGWTGPEVERAYSRAGELCKCLDDPPEVFPSLLGVWAVHALREHLEDAFEIARQLLQLAHVTKDPVHFMYAEYALGFTSFWMGELVRAREHLEKAIAEYDAQLHRRVAFLYGFDVGVHSQSYLALTLAILGFLDQALERSNQAFAMAQLASNPVGMAFAAGAIGSVHHYRRETLAVQQNAEKVIELTNRHGLTEVLPIVIAQRGWALAEEGQYEEGIRQILEVLIGLRATGASLVLTYVLNLLADSCTHIESFEERQRVLLEATNTWEKPEGRLLKAETLLFSGKFLLEQGDSHIAEAQSRLEEAIAVARRQLAKILELRATTTLAFLFAKQGRQAEAHAMLAEIYGWFTEGFDTADLKDAKSLLDDLQRQGSN